MTDFPQASDAEIREYTDFFLSLVTTVLTGDDCGMLALLDRRLAEQGISCWTGLALASIGPKVAAMYLRELAPVPPDYWGFEASPGMAPEVVALHQAVTAQLNDDSDAAADVISTLHHTGSCAAVREMVIAAVYLCAALEVQRLRQRVGTE